MQVATPATHEGRCASLKPLLHLQSGWKHHAGTNPGLKILQTGGHTVNKRSRELVGQQIRSKIVWSRYEAVELLVREMAYTLRHFEKSSGLHIHIQCEDLDYQNVLSGLEYPPWSCLELWDSRYCGISSGMPWMCQDQPSLLLLTD